MGEPTRAPLSRHLRLKLGIGLKLRSLLPVKIGKRPTRVPGVVSLQMDAGADAAFGPATYRALVVACLLQLYQQLSGANMTLYFSAALIEKVAGASPVWTAWCAPALCGPHAGHWRWERSMRSCRNSRAIVEERSWETYPSCQGHGCSARHFKSWTCPALVHIRVHALSAGNI
jgi:hypothetical protein